MGGRDGRRFPYSACVVRMLFWRQTLDFVDRRVVTHTTVHSINETWGAAEGATRQGSDLVSVHGVPDIPTRGSIISMYTL